MERTGAPPCSSTLLSPNNTNKVLLCCFLRIEGLSSVFPESEHFSLLPFFSLRFFHFTLEAEKP